VSGDAHLPRPGLGLRVVHLGKLYPPAPGGIEAHVGTLARAQARLGAEVEVLCFNHLDASGRDVTDLSVAVTPDVSEWDGPVRVARLGRIAKVARMDLAPRLLPELWRLRWRGVDVLHVHAPNPAALAALAAVPPFATLIITHHSDVVRQRVLGAAFRPLELWVYARAARVLATSQRYAEGSPVLRRFEGKVEALPLGIELAPFLSPSAAALEHERRLREESAGGPLWLTVGRLVYYKGLDVALEALREVPGRLRVVGIGPVRAELEQRARELGVASRVTFAGHVDADALVGAYRAATALWFPSTERSEGFGLAQVEAMASGCPVINTDVPHSGVAWVSPHERTGLTVPVRDARALAAAARRLLDEPGLRERLAQAGIARAKAELDSEVMAERCIDIYRRVLGLAAPPREVAASSRAEARG
jgi:glycosyltransferase involved in cell wall biosynthesis